MGELKFKDNLMYGNVSLCKGEILASNYFSNETSEEEICQKLSIWHIITKPSRHEDAVYAAKFNLVLS